MDENVNVPTDDDQPKDSVAPAADGDDAEAAPEAEGEEGAAEGVVKEGGDEEEKDEDAE